ncbi:hypothetical protein ACE1AT_25090 [Pelatocladus sp. BLCC-F211]|uniref:hypothetical protein n=1 Tax=Pelatocladus sp. BLCC-F211 TaxID=3342752 RepID=UPI0035BB78A6
MLVTVSKNQTELGSEVASFGVKAEQLLNSTNRLQAIAQFMPPLETSASSPAHPPLPRMESKPHLLTSPAEEAGGS